MDDADGARRATIGVLDDMTALAAECELPAPDPPDHLKQARARLVENRHRVLVVGEAKRGKSSFVNALVGVEVLPTDVAVATSQVFCVGAADREAYRLRFEDDSTRTIARGDLARFGSQVLEDAGEQPRLDQVLRYIEVDLPGARFLPNGVSLLDTPGLGALYAAHQQITERLVPLADATVFVLDSERPIMRSELDFVATILDATPDVFFVQTKSDLFGREQVESIQAQNQALLAKTFPALDGVAVWPISNRLLLAAATDDEDAAENLEDSGHAEMEEALRAFLFRVAGWRRVAETLVSAGRYHESGRQVLAMRHASVAEQSRAEQEARQARVKAWRDDFLAEWGPRGTEYLRVVNEIQEITDQGVARMRLSLAAEGRLVGSRRDEIDNATSVSTLTDLNERLAAELLAAAQEELHTTARQVQQSLSALLEPFFDQAVAAPWAAGEPKGALQLQGREVVAGRGALWEKVRGATRDFTISSSLGFALIYATGGVVATGGLALIPALAGMAWATVHGWRRAGEIQVERLRSEVRQNFERLVRKLRAQLLDPDPPGRPTSLVEENFMTIRTAAIELVHTTAARKQKEAKAEHARMVKAANLDAQQRHSRIDELSGQLDRWDALGRELDELSVRLARMRQTAEADEAAEPVVPRAAVAESSS